MKPKTIVAFLLIALGIVAFAYQGITTTSHGRDLDIGPMHMSVDETHHIPLPPIVGAVALVGGFALLLLEKRNLGRAVTR